MKMAMTCKGEGFEAEFGGRDSVRAGGSHLVKPYDTPGHPFMCPMKIMEGITRPQVRTVAQPTGTEWSL